MYLHKIFNKQRTPQTLPIPGAGQVANSAGGFAWALDDWVRLDRFLVLGAEGGTYYVGEQRLTLENAGAGLPLCRTGWAACGGPCCGDQRRLAVRPRMTLRSLRWPSPSARATRLHARLHWPPCLRWRASGTHLFHFLAYVENFRGWGRGLRRAVANWYNEMPIDHLAYQVIKYQQRDGWSHRDALRLAHPKAEDEQRNALYRWIVRGWPVVDESHSTMRACAWSGLRRRQAGPGRADHHRSDHRRWACRGRLCRRSGWVIPKCGVPCCRNCH